MKKLSLCLSLFLSATLLAPLSGAQEMMVPAPPDVAAGAWILMDAETGHVITEHHADEPMHPASLTKMMTGYVVSSELAKGRVAIDDEAIVSENAWRTGGWASGSSVMSLEPNERVTIKDLMRGVIISSGNDASIVLAEHLAGSERAFADIMNHYAQGMGMTNTNFVNATGLTHEEQLTTARDMATLARHVIYDFPEHYSIYAEKYFEYDNVRQPNRNRLLWRDNSVDGIKTGHTDAAGYCLAASAERDGMRLISVVMNTAGEEVRARETQKLLSYGFRYYERADLFDRGDRVVEDVRVWYGEDESVDVVVGEPVKLTIVRGARDSLETEVVLPDQLRAPFEQGDELGTLRISQGDSVLAEVPLLAQTTVERAGFFARIWDAIKLFVIGIFS